MLVILLSLIHIVFSLTLILIVLLQTGKGSDMASAFGGGGSQTVFGSAGSASMLSKITTWAAILFMVSATSLAVVSSRSGSIIDESDSIMEESADFGPEETLPGGEMPMEGEPGTVPGEEDFGEDVAPDQVVPMDSMDQGAIPDADAGGDMGDVAEESDTTE